MKILWLTNIPVGGSITSTGSWLENLSSKLEDRNNIELIYCFPSTKKYSEKNKYTFNKDGNSEFFRKILVQENIDLVHIHGTEMYHSYEMSEVCKELHVPFVISIQGLVSIICNHLEADLPKKVISGKTFRNIVLRDSIKGLSKQYFKKGLFEKKAIQNSKFIIGRTNWDFAMVNEINETAEYFSCNEVLRKNFYETNSFWDIKKIDRNMIFVSQASYSLKGLHYLLDAMPSILKKFPNTHIVVAGKKMNKPDSLKELLKETYYAKYIQKLIKNMKLEENISFTGNLTAEEMKQHYLNAHIFVSLSTMENESNSLSEAKMMGVPVVGSYVGGVVDRINHGEDGYLYQHNSPEMLSFFIKKIFESDGLATLFSVKGRKKAEEVFDIEKNVTNIENVYLKILGEYYE